MNQISLPLLPIGKIIWRKQLTKLFSKLELLDAPDSLKLETQIKDIVHNYIHKSKQIKSIWYTIQCPQNILMNFEISLDFHFRKALNS